MAESLVYVDENGNTLGHILVSGPVTVLQTPVTERYCKPGDTAQLDIKSKQIRCGGAWFNFNDRWLVKPFMGEPNKIKVQSDIVLENEQKLTVNPNVITYAEKFGKKEAYLYNNRLLRGIINATELDKSQYNVNWEYINSL